MDEDQKREIGRQIVLIEKTVGFGACIDRHDEAAILAACRRISDVLAGEPVN